MQANSSNFSLLSQPQIYEIPFFQRSYVWDENNWEQLLENLQSSQNSYLGSIIFREKQKAVPGSSYTKFSIIDGQQRLTTVSILLKVINDLLSEEIKRVANINISALLFIYDFSKRESVIRIKHSKNDAPRFEDALNGKIDVRTINDNSHKILKCYKYFKSEISKLKEEEILRLFEKLTMTECFVSITLSDIDNEQAIFDTINNAGVRLTSADTIKNAIFQKALDLCGTNQQERKSVISLYESSWEQKFSENDDMVIFWDSERSIGRLKRTNLDLFLYSFALIKKFYDPYNNKIDELPNCYKNHIESMNLKEIIMLINEIEKYAHNYYLIYDDYQKNDSSFNNQINKILLILDKWDISTFAPYVLYCFTEFNPSECNNRLFVLEKYILRSYLCRRSNKNFNKECYHLIHSKEKELLIEQLLSSPELNDEEVEKNLKFSKRENKIPTLVLFLLELHRRNSPHCGEKTLKYVYSLEHLMPQSLGQSWSIGTLPVYDENGEKIEDIQKAEEMRNSKIYALGNMTLLTRSLNSSIKNKRFEIKINGDSKNDGIRKLSSLFITTNDIIKPLDEGNKVWDERNINERTKLLYKEIVSIW
jgi:uncharacterized protein with ParB-like and HNH nuclease domain